MSTTCIIFKFLLLRCYTLTLDFVLKCYINCERTCLLIRNKLDKSDRINRKILSSLLFPADDGSAVVSLLTSITTCWDFSFFSVMKSSVPTVVMSVLMLTRTGLFVGTPVLPFRVVLSLPVFIFPVVLTVTGFSVALKQIVSISHCRFWENVHPSGGLNSPSGYLSHLGTWLYKEKEIKFPVKECTLSGLGTLQHSQWLSSIDKKADINTDPELAMIYMYISGLLHNIWM